MIAEAFSLSGPADVDVSATSGSVLVESGPAGTAEVTIETNRPEDWRVSCRSDALIIHHTRSGWSGRGRAAIRIVVPERSKLRIATASADVRVTVAAERASVSTASGDIWIAEAEWISVKTASGEVSVGTVARDVAVKSASGDVHIDHAEGDTSVTTASGDTVIDTARGATATSSASGDIRIHHYLGDDLDANTMSGNITFALPSGVKVRLQATTLSGDLSLPERRPSESGGTARPVTIKAKSVSGDITLTRLD